MLYFNKMEHIKFDEWQKLDLRVGKILEVNQHPNADKLYLLKVDIGDKTVQLVAGIRPFYEPDELLDKSVAVLTNLEQKEIRGVVSEGMLLAAQGSEYISAIVSDKDVAPGAKIR